MSPPLGKRKVALHQKARQQLPSPPADTPSGKRCLATCHRDSLLVYLEHAYKPFMGKHKTLEADDDTATTMSASESESDDEKMVTFCEPLVTAVRTRPRTTRAEKYFLHYNEHDYVDFKVQYMTGRERTRKVSFAQETKVHKVQPVAAEKKVLFYSESELQGFLDEFIKSLNR